MTTKCKKCRAGITTDLANRRVRWKLKYGTLYGWRTYGPYRTREAAQAKEDSLKKDYGCVAYPGGKGATGPWYAYRFEFYE